MNYLVERLTVKGRLIVVDEEHVMDVLKIFNDYIKELHMLQMMYDFKDMCVECGGRKNKSNAWYITIDISEAKWAVIKHQLKDSGFKVSVADEKFIFWWTKLKEL